MRIAIFTTGIYPYITGGMQKHSYYLAKYLRNLLIKSELVTTVAGGYAVYQIGKKVL